MKTLALLTALAALVPQAAGAAGPAPQPSPPQAGPHVQVLPVPADLDALDALDRAASDRTPGTSSAGSPDSAAADDRLRVAARVRPCAAQPPAPVRDGEPIVVQLAPGTPFTIGAIGRGFWDKPQVSDPTWQLWLYSLRWIGPLVRSAVEGKQEQARERLVAQVLRFYRDHPDSGRPTSGWDEGSSLRRLETLNCLYRMTTDQRLVAPMTTEVTLLFGPRYYGPPHHAVHNHGLMANLRIVEAGRLVGRTDWATRAGARIRSEAGLAFTPLGTSYEQSSGYQGINAQLWDDAARTLAELEPADPVVAAITRTVARARGVAEWLTEPDGRIVQIGDSAANPGFQAPQRTDVGPLRDDVAGLVVGRWSWKDPATTYYTLRYGPPRRAHGHHDKASVTWSTAGTRVLVGSGYFGYEASDRFVQYQKTPESSNVALPVGAKLRTTQGARVTRSIVRGTRHRWWLSDTVFGRSHGRSVDVDQAARTLTVSDAFAGKGAADQIWHLDPAWQAVSVPAKAKALVFRHRDGRELRIRTTGTLVSAVKGATQPVAGWTFPQPRSRVAAWQLRIRWSAGTATTTFTVR